MNKLELNNQLFDTILKAAATENFKRELDEMPTEEGLKKEYAPSQKLEKELQRMVKKDYQTKVFRKIGRFAKRAAVIVAIIIPISFGSLLSVEACRNAIFNSILEWRADHVDIHFQNDSSDQPSQDIDKNSLYQPQYIPDGFTRSKTIQIGPTCEIKYEKNQNESVIFDQTPLEKAGTTMVDTEHTTYKEITIHGKKAFLFASKTPGDTTSIFWQDDKTSFMLSSSISQHELIKIAESIQVQDK